MPTSKPHVCSISNVTPQPYQPAGDTSIDLKVSLSQTLGQSEALRR